MTRRAVMARRWRASALAVGGVALALALAGGVAAPLESAPSAPSSGPSSGPPAARAISADPVLAKGEYLARAADCIACHTADPAQPFAGGVPFKTPFGTIYAPNITPDADTGIGQWGDAAFLAALHRGIRKDGKRLYPAFPYTAYTKLSDDDVLAIKRYLFAQRPIHFQPPANQLTFPFNLRFLLVFWNWLNFDEGRWHDEPGKTAAWNRGAYLVEGLGHCAECHTPRNITQGLSHRAFAGARIEGWEAYNITPDTASGIGRWSEDDIVRYLKTGAAPAHAWAAGPMAEVIQNSTQYLVEDDLRAIAVYLRSLEPQASRDKGEAHSHDARDARGQPSDALLAVRGMPAAVRDMSSQPQTGVALYGTYCASCHGWRGTGTGQQAGPTGDMPYPPLMHNSVTGALHPDNLVQVILHGVHRQAQGTTAFMPGFADVLSDQDVALLVNDIRHRFGAREADLDAGDVKTLRAAAAP